MDTMPQILAPYIKLGLGWQDAFVSLVNAGIIAKTNEQAFRRLFLDQARAATETAPVATVPHINMPPLAKIELTGLWG